MEIYNNNFNHHFRDSSNISEQKSFVRIENSLLEHAQPKKETSCCADFFGFFYSFCSHLLKIFSSLFCCNKKSDMREIKDPLQDKVFGEISFRDQALIAAQTKYGLHPTEDQIAIERTKLENRVTEIED